MSQDEWDFSPGDDEAYYRGRGCSVEVYILGDVVRVRAEEGYGYMAQYTDVSIPVHILRAMLRARPTARKRPRGQRRQT